MKTYTLVTGQREVKLELMKGSSLLVLFSQLEEVVIKDHLKVDLVYYNTTLQAI